MTKVIATTAVAAILAMAAVIPTEVRANDTGAIVGGAIGGLALGAIIGTAASQPRPYYAPPPAYAPAPVYMVPEREVCIEPREVWSPHYQAYVVRNVRTPCY